MLQTLADIGYPAGDEALEPLAASVLKTWLHPRYYREYDPTAEPRADAVPVIEGRYRRCGSQHGGALLALVRLGLGGDGPGRLVERLRYWQWPDGGWNLYRRSNGRLIRADWARLHYPVYWHYDLLAGLKGLGEAGHLSDPRCADALDLLERKRLPDGGWAAEASFVHGVDRRRQHYDLVEWGGADPQRRNEWVTVDALAVLAAAGRT